MSPATYFAAARRLRHYAGQIERYASPATPRELGRLTRAIHGTSLYAQGLSQRHRVSAARKGQRVAVFLQGDDVASMGPRRAHE